MKTVLLFLSLLAIASSQTFQGSIRGRVLDPTETAAKGARITLIDEQTKVIRSTVSNDLGEYVFNSVTPSTYTLSSDSPGFKHLERKNILVSTQSNLTLDLTLELGQVSEQVVVTEEVPLLQTADASTGQVIDAQKITDLPSLGRNPFYMAKLAQTVIFAGNPKFARMQDQNANSQVSIAGGPLRTNNYLIDGISITDSTNRAVILPSPEAVQEMKLQASTYDAEVGRTGGGAFNTLLRSGTNDIHGSAVGHIRQTDWLANNFFANRAGQAIADQPFRDWAGSIGGPIFVPKLYDGHNRTFFFISTEAYRQRDGSTTALSVPTALERRGDFSQSFSRTGRLQTIYDPLSTKLDGTRTPFPGNIVPAERLNNVGLALVSYYPLPNSPTAYHGSPNYNVTGSYPNRGDQSTWKADHQFASWLRASGSYIHQKTFETAAPDLFGNAGSPNQGYCCDRKIDATQANATITPDATTVVALRWGFNRFYTKSSQASGGFDLSRLGLPQWLVDATPNTAFPAITMADVSSFGGGGTTHDVYYSRSFNSTVSKFLGRHSAKAGFEYRTVHDAGTPSSGPTSFSFNDVFTRPNPRASTAGQGSSLASLLLGYPSSGSMNVVTKFNNFVNYYGGFVQDDFRITSKLVLNLGLRFEYESGVQDTENKLIVGFDAKVRNPLQATVPGIPVLGAVQYAAVDGNPTQTGSPRSIKLGPRLGFAYSFDNKTVIRGGYGIFWAPTFFNFQNAIGYSQSTSIIASTDGNFTPSASLSDPYPNGLLQPTGNSSGGLSGIGQAIAVFDPAAKSAGYVQQLSLEAQRETPLGLVITVGLLASRGLHLLRSGVNIDQLDPAFFSLGSGLTQNVPNPFYNNGGVGTIGTPTIARAQLLLPFPQYSSVNLSNSDTANSRYYSFYVRAERRYANGLSVLASYTWSRGMDDMTGLNTAGTNQIAAVAGPQNARNLRSEWSLSTQDVPNRFTSAVTYELPMGTGKPLFGNSNGWLNLITGGWSINAMATVQSGYPLAVTQPNNNTVVGGSYQRPNATGVPAQTQGSTTERLNRWLDPAAFVQASQFTFGNVSRFLNVRGPSLANLDFSAFKTFSIRERLRAQFRAEALNATNTPTFGNPNTTFTNNQFGLITAQVNNPRLLQLGVRVTF